MRRLVAFVLVSLIPAAPLAAQFEGTINIKTYDADGMVDSKGFKVAIKGDMQATTVTLSESAGPMAGKEVRSIYDSKANTVTMLIPMPPNMPMMAAMADAKGMKNVIDLSKLSNREDDSKIEIKKLGTSEKIAGLDCDDYEITTNKGSPTRACVTDALGHFMFPQSGGGMGARGSAPPAWARAFGNKAAFPLKVWEPGGKVSMEVTSVEKGSIPASAFEIPAGYVDMAAMMHGRGGR